MNNLFHEIREPLFTPYASIVNASDKGAFLFSLALVALSLALLLVFTTLKKPEWLSDDEVEDIDKVRQRWTLTTILATVLSLTVSLGIAIACIALNSGVIAPVLAVTAQAVTFALVFSILTDTTLRLVDRRLLRAVMAITFLAGAYSIVVLLDSSYVFFVYVLILAILSIAFFFPKYFGASDSRALFISFASVFPYLGQTGVTVTWIASMIVAFVYIGIKQKGNVKKILTEKVSLPLVPILLAPVAVSLVASPFIISSGILAP